MGRLVVVSNRVAPIAEGEPTTGGLAAGVMDALKATGGLWFGWSGEISPVPAAARLAQRFGGVTLYTQDLTQLDYDQFYRGFANGTLWPTLHYQTSLSRFDWVEFAGYRRVNAQFARALAGLVAPDDTIWVHDYHLFCLAEALRAEGLTNRIGLFLHTPFPEPQVLMSIPAHDELVRSMCQFDLLGFQTDTDRVAFEDYLVRDEGAVFRERGRLEVFDRIVRTGVYPIGIHVDEIREQAIEPSNRVQATRLRNSLQARGLILSVDRLDYSKGLPQRFRAFERFLELNPHRKRHVAFVQIAPPSRSDIDTYREIRRELEAESGRINGRFAEIDWEPLHYLNQSYPRPVLMPIYAEARVGLVTPMRDGMNLVAKEYVAAQDPDDPGVLVLSQFAGAAKELQSALLVNPFDMAGIAAALERGLTMRAQERRERCADMVSVLRRNSLDVWRDRFVADLAGV